MSNRLVIALLALTIGVQLSMLYKQGAPSMAIRERIQKPPEGTTINLTDVPMLGSDDASVVFVEFSDYECPFCQRHASTVGRHIQNQYVATGQIRYAFLNHPLPMHPNAIFLATAALCAVRQGRYWEMHNAIFESSVTTRPEIVSLAEDVGLSATMFERCLDDNELNSLSVQRIAREIQTAERLGLIATPGFALGRMDSEGLVRIDTLISGAQPFEVFKAAVVEMLALPGS